MTAAWTGISAAQHDAHSHSSVADFVTGGQTADNALAGGNLPTVGTITLVTDVAGQITALRDAADARLDLIETAVNGLIAAAGASGLTA